MFVFQSYRARDWGKTDYHIIRNWTPRVPKQANNQSDDSGNQSNQSPDYSTAAPVINPDSGGSSRVDDILDDIDNPAPADSDIAESQVIRFPSAHKYKCVYYVYIYVLTVSPIASLSLVLTIYPEVHSCRMEPGY